MSARSTALALQREDGMTLIETLVSAVVSFLIVGALAAGYLAGLQSFQSYETNSNVERDVEKVRTMFVDDVRSAVPSAGAITSTSPTHVEQCPTTCPTTAPISGQKLVLGIYDDKTGSFDTIVWAYTDASKTLTRQVTVGTATPGPLQVVANTLYPGFTGATNSVFTIESDGVTVTLALPVPPFSSSTQQSELRKIRAVMRPTKR
jgi:type II secretory pathway pseudopilin PulG